MKHRTGLPAAIGTLIAAMLSSSATAAIEVDAGSIEHWKSVPDEQLGNLRGGLDLGLLMASFAIERLVRIDGQIVARTQLIVSGLDRLAHGGLPDIRLVGNLANLVQIGLGNLMVDVGIEPAAPAASPGSSGAVSATGIASGSMAQFGAGLALGVAAANGDLPSPAQSGTPASAAAPPAASAAAAPATAAVAAPSGSSITVPVGNTGQVIVISAIPDASTLATSIQNSAQATRIETQTSIDATLGSLAALRSVNFAASLRQQAIDSVRR